MIHVKSVNINEVIHSVPICHKTCLILLVTREKESLVTVSRRHYDIIITSGHLEYHSSHFECHSESPGFKMPRTSNELLEQRHNIRFCIRLDKTANETWLIMKQTYGNGCMARASVLRWYPLFKEGRQNAEDLPRPGRPVEVPTPQNIDKVKTLVQQDARLTTIDIAENVNMGAKYTGKNSNVKQC